MPELPEVESVRRSLLPHLRGRTIVDVRVHRRDVIRVVGPRGEERRPTPRGAAPFLLHHGRITDVSRHGKQVALLADTTVGRRALVVHLGMSGQLFCLAPGAHLPNPTHVHVVWRLDSGARLVFRDPRRFGGLWALPSADVSLARRWSRLGPDALSITPSQLLQRLAHTRRAIKAALLDQSVIAGIGNIYADEALHLARIHPLTPASSLRTSDVHRLARAIRTVLDAAISAGGSSLTDFVDGDGAQGRYQHSHAVYGRTGLPCLVCGQTLESSAVSNRTTVWCPRCQPNIPHSDR